MKSKKRIHDPITRECQYSRNFSPKEYLYTYFGPRKPIYPDEEVIANYQKQFLHGKKFERAIEVGAGPVLYHAIITTPHVERELVITDYIQTNLDEIQKWLDNKKDAFDWDFHIRQLLQLVQGRMVTKEEISERKKEMRKKMRVAKLDISTNPPRTGISLRPKFDFLQTFYCVDAATTDLDEYYSYMKNTFVMLQNGGEFILSSLANTNHYIFGGRKHFVTRITKDILRKALVGAGIKNSSLDIQHIPVPECSEDGFPSVLIASGMKRK
jgi:hypothetical protein